ncbi:spore cortex-lytic enzyme [Priestia endophytica]|uniref:spore cortex-lytic enzyme n=1 Tax=Priestia endophytica TaxID=135735 RepID=UPI002283069C|nr:spore cortex-lytic enzyme [Priestia endophytica]MCY8232768.1 spore cortex-lytic enzyme [Priestia endophytica]
MIRFRKVRNILFVLFICQWVFIPTFSDKNVAKAFSNQVIQHGAVGNDVIELQSRLQYVGFYTGPIDGVFGWRTYWASRNFQYEFGMKVDGLVGPEMKRKLVAATKYHEGYVKEQIRKGRNFSHYGNIPLDQQVKKGSSGSKGGGQAGGGSNKGGTSKGSTNNAGQKGTSGAKGNQASPGGNQGTQQSATKTGSSNKPQAANVPDGYSQNDINLMANAVYGEARGEPYIGQVAVAAVIINRTESPSFPDTPAGVIFEPGAFTAVADGQIWLTPNQTAKNAVLDALNGMDPTGNAEYYFNPDTATSAWIWSRPQIKKIGKHIFCR